MIKNEEEFLRASLDSAREIADEILIVDTGSTDKSLEIAREFKKHFEACRILEASWMNDFSKTRNQIAKEAQFEWVLFIDGDEILDPASSRELKSKIENTDVACFSLIQRNYCRENQVIESQLVEEKDLPGLNGFDLAKVPLYFFDNWMERLYNKKTGITYQGKIHESLIPSCRQKKKKFEKTNLILHHYGRLKNGQREKLEIYLKLTKEKWKEEQDNPAAWIELLIVLSELQLFDEAFHAARLGYRLFSNEKEFIKPAAHIALQMAEYVQAEAWLKMAIQNFPEDRLFFQSQLTTALLYQGKLKECAQLANSILLEDPKDFLSHLHLGVIEFEKKNWKPAEEHLRVALQRKPDDRFILNALQNIAGQQQKN